MRFSQRELKDLFIAWILLSVAFAIAQRLTTDWVTNFTVAALTVGVAFIAHELGHKFVAQHYKKFAEFRASLPMLVITLVLSFTRIIIAAPGAVVISGFVSQKQSGHIALAGPLVNVALAVLLIPLYLLVDPQSMIGIILGYGAIINSWLALFNLIPFGMFDGAKIIAWDKKMYGAMVVVSVVLAFIAQIIGPL